MFKQEFDSLLIQTEVNLQNLKEYLAVFVELKLALVVLLARGNNAL